MTEARTAAESAGGGQAPKPRVRIPFWDNARFGTIVLVVMGHAIQRQTTDSDNALALYLVVNAFHMPAFAIISGYFTKASPPGQRQMRKIVTDILIPYLIMQFLWSGVQWIVEGDPGLNLTEPHWTLWFLLALALFRVVLPYLVMLRWPMLWAVLMSIGVGYVANVDSTFSLSRAIGILPFFLLGWYLRHWKIVDRWRTASTTTVVTVRIAAAAVFAAWLTVVLVNVRAFRDFQLKDWFFYDGSYHEIDWWSGFLRLGFLALAVVLSAAFYSLIPRRETIVTAFGQATMYVYLLHSFVLYPIRESGILRDDHSSAVWLLTMVFASIAIAIALSSPLVRRVFRPVIEPKPDWLFHALDETGKPAGGAQGHRARTDRNPTTGSLRTDPTGSRRSE